MQQARSETALVELDVSQPVWESFFWQSSCHSGDR